MDAIKELTTPSNLEGSRFHDDKDRDRRIKARLNRYSFDKREDFNLKFIDNVNDESSEEEE